MKRLNQWLLAALTLACLSVTVSAQAQTACEKDPEAHAKQLMQLYIDMKNSKDVSQLRQMYTDNYIENTGRNPSGFAALEANWKGQFQAIPDLKTSLHDLIVSRDKIVARITYSGTHTVPFFAGIPATGKTFNLGTIDIWRVEGCKLAEHWDQVDFAGLQRQLMAK